MAKELHWFKFSPLKWMTGRIQRESQETRDLFLILCCQYWKNECKMSVESCILEIGEEAFNKLSTKKIVKVDGDDASISFLDEQMEEISATSEQKSNAAKSRWKKEQSKSMHVHADALHVQEYALQNDADKIRQEEIRPDKTRQEQIRTEQKRESSAASAASPLRASEKKTRDYDLPAFEGGLLTAWLEWEQHRKEKKKKLTPSTAKKQIQFLGGRAPTEAIGIINQSITNGWTGLFELKNNSNYVSGTASKTSTIGSSAILNRPKDWGEF